MLNEPETPMSEEQLLEAYRWMRLSRGFDERAFSLQRQGKLGTFSQALGQEASIIGSAMATDPAADWLVPQYREVMALVRHGYPLSQFILYFRGHPAGNRIPADVKCLPVQISLAAQLPHAVGLAWGLRLQKRKGAVLAYVGDGASSEGDFHEACNLAGVTRAPVVLFLQNNGWAISTPRARQSAATSLASRATGYGIHGVTVDGNDLLAVYDVTREAIARARRGDGATLIESLTYRLGAHNTADDPTKYIADPAADMHGVSDPLARLKTYLSGRGLMDESVEVEIDQFVETTVATALDVANSVPAAVPSDLFDHVYTTEPIRVQRQRLALGASADSRTDGAVDG